MHLERTQDGSYVFHVFAAEDSIDRRDLVGSGWVARLTGLHPAYRYARMFLDHPRGKDAWYDLRDGEVYEYRRLYRGGSRYAYEKRGGISGFFTIEHGEIVRLDESRAREKIKGSGPEVVVEAEASTR